MRLILGLIAGLLVGGATVALVETAGHMIFPPPPGVDLTDPAQLRTLMGRVPTGALVAVLIAWAAGVFAGGYAAARIARRGPWPAWAIGAALFGGAVWSMMMIPHPPWMIAGAVVLTIAFAWLAGRLGARGAA